MNRRDRRESQNDSNRPKNTARKRFIPIVPRRAIKSLRDFMNGGFAAIGNNKEIRLATDATKQSCALPKIKRLNVAFGVASDRTRTFLCAGRENAEKEKNLHKSDYWRPTEYPEEPLKKGDTGGI